LARDRPLAESLRRELEALRPFFARELEDLTEDLGESMRPGDHRLGRARRNGLDARREPRSPPS